MDGVVAVRIVLQAALEWVWVVQVAGAEVAAAVVRSNES
jgi:hypothetical protein